jgi:hypothetical protein
MGAKEILDTTTVLATTGLAVLTGIFAFSTYRIGKATRLMLAETRTANFRQIQIQSWLEFNRRFDSAEMTAARKELAGKLMTPGQPLAAQDQYSELVTAFFEDLGAVYQEESIHRQLAKNTFGYYACLWWEALKPYIAEQRKLPPADAARFGQFEKLAGAMRREGEQFSGQEIADFLAGEAKMWAL